MEPKEVFGIIVRTAGLLLILYASEYLAFGIAQASGLSEESFPTGDYLISGGASLILGLVLLVGARTVVRLAYRDNPPISN